MSNTRGCFVWKRKRSNTRNTMLKWCTVLRHMNTVLKFNLFFICSCFNFFRYMTDIWARMYLTLTWVRASSQEDFHVSRVHRKWSEQINTRSYSRVIWPENECWLDLFPLNNSPVICLNRSYFTVFEENMKSCWSADWLEQPHYEWMIIALVISGMV